MDHILFSPLRLNELEILIEKSVERALKKNLTSSQPDPNEALPVEAAAKEIGKAVSTLYSMVSRREIAYIKKGKRLLFLRRDLQAYLESGRREAK